MLSHAVLKSYELLNRARERSADIDDIQDLKLIIGHIVKIGLISAERRCADIVAADIKDDRVPIKNESGSDLGGKRKRLDTRAGVVRGNESYLLLLDKLAALGQAEVCVDHIKVDKLGALTSCRCLNCEVQRKFTLATAVVSYKDFYFLHWTCPF